MYLQVLRTYYAEYLCAKLLFKLHDIHDTMFGVQEEEPINKIFHLSLSEVYTCMNFHLYNSLQV